MKMGSDLVTSTHQDPLCQNNTNIAMDTKTPYVFDD